MKTCLRCLAELPFDAFSRHQGRPDGYQAYCKPCTAAIGKASRDRRAQRETIITPADKCCARCGEVKPSAAFYPDRRQRDGLYANCRACHDGITAAYAAAKPEVRATIVRRSYVKHQVRHRQRSREWAWANPGKRAEAQRLWRIANRAHRAYVQARRKARKANARGTATEGQLRARWDYYGGLCWMCREPATSVDHVKPLEVGGTDWPANQRPACRSCNSSKGAMWPLTGLPDRLAELWVRRARRGALRPAATEPREVPGIPPQRVPGSSYEAAAGSPQGAR